MSSGSTTQARGRNSLPTQTEAAATTKMAGSDQANGRAPKQQGVVTSVGGSGPSDERLRATAIALLQLQDAMRKTRNHTELAYFIANEPRQLFRAQQVIVLERGLRNDFIVRAISSLSSVDRSSPLVLWFESVAVALEKSVGLDDVREFDANALPGEFSDVVNAYPLPHVVWVPWVDADNAVIGGLLLTRAAPWTSQDLTIARHLASAFAHAWRALKRPSLWPLVVPMISPRNMAIAVAIAALLLLFPVPMSALAPVEVVPRNPTVVTSGVEGVIKSVHVEPNEHVKAGRLLVRLTDIALKNRLEVAEREVLVAETRYKRASQLAFTDARGRHELAVAKTELDLKVAERNYAADLFARAEIKADRDGIAFFADKKDLVGKPITVGERLMEIAGADSAEFHIELPVADAIVIREGASVKVFLDSDPLNPISARLLRSAYKAVARDGQPLAFRLVAEMDSSKPRPLRFGVRGTAQVYSDRVPLGFYLLRRPITAARQWLGL